MFVMPREEGARKQKKNGAGHEKKKRVCDAPREGCKNAKKEWNGAKEEEKACGCPEGEENGQWKTSERGKEL